MTQARRRTITIVGLTAPAYLWLALTVLFPLCAMLYFSFLTFSPMGGRETEFTLRHYQSFFEKRIYWYNAWRSIEPALSVPGFSLLLVSRGALGPPKQKKGRGR